MGASKKVTELPVLNALDGDEVFYCAKNGLDRSVPASLIAGGTTSGWQTTVTPEQFGASGYFNVASQTGQDDAPAWNAMLTYLRGQQYFDPLFGGNVGMKAQVICRPGAIYNIASTLNMTNFRDGLVIFGMGSTIYSKDIDNKPMIDALHSLGITFRDLTLFAPNGASTGTGKQPAYGLVIGRSNTDEASEIRLDNVKIEGWFNKVCLLNISSELFSMEKGRLQNAVSPTFVGDVYGGLCLHVTVSNHDNFVSDFVTQTALPTFGMGNHWYNQVNMNSSQGRAIHIEGPTGKFRFQNCYVAMNQALAAVTLEKSHSEMYLDIHVETANVLYNVLMDASTGSMDLRDFTVIDDETQALYMLGGTGIGVRNILTGDIRAPSAFQAGAKIFAPGSLINYAGRILLGTQASLQDLSGANSLRADVYTPGAGVSVAGPGSGNVRVVSQSDEYQTYSGFQGKSGFVQGAWIVDAPAVALVDGATVPLDAMAGNVFHLTAAGNRTILAPTNTPLGSNTRRMIIRHEASGGDRTLTLTTGSAGAFRFGSTVSALTATLNGKIDYIGCIYHGTAQRWDVVAYAKGF